MKKIALSLAGVLAATAFAPEASAVPAFSRQTGMACSACHFQHFPVLNSFGMAFKAAGYTMMGAQGKVEGDHLSIPDTMNVGGLIKIRYQKTNGTTPDAITGSSTNSGQWQMPDEFALFFSGRVAENIGVHIEANLAGNAANTAGTSGNGGIATGFKMPFMFDVGSGAKVGVVPFWTDVLGMAHGFELSSSGLVRGLRWAEDRNVVSAANFIGMNSGSATGLAFVAKNDFGYFNWTRYSPTMPGTGNATAGAMQFRSNWVRLAATPTYQDWNMHIGVGLANGSNYTNAQALLGAAGVKHDRKASIIDFQGQTQVGGKDFSLYASYATAPSGVAVAGVSGGNVWNTNARSKNAWQVGADYSVIQHVLHVAGSYLRGDTGAATANKDNRYMIQAIYDMQQNVALHASYTKRSGSAYTTLPKTGDSLVNLMLEASF